MNTTIDLQADIIDVRDIIARVEELREERDIYEDPEADICEDPEADIYEDPEADSPNMADWADVHPDEAEELTALKSILEDLAGNGGDEEWEGDWYPVTLIRDSYFQDYAQELAKDCGFTAGNEWPARCIDWEQAAWELRQDYASTEVYGSTYWYR